VLVTDGGRATADGKAGEEVIHASPRPVLVTRVTGAGDTFMAAHLVAERRGSSRHEALSRALDAAATYVSGDVSS
jgi:sugar/nucleoside kinase (ribokinase family)